MSGCSAAPAKVLVVDRGEWLTGAAKKILSGSQLREARSGLKCCLGFECLREGLSEARITNVAMPRSLAYINGDQLEPLPYEAWMDERISSAEFELLTEGAQNVHRHHGANVQDLLADTNDNVKLHPIRREARIAKLFKKYGGIEVQFVGRYADATAKARKAMKEAA